MEAALAKLLVKLAEYGPGFILAAIIAVVWVLDRKGKNADITVERERNTKLEEKNDKLAEKLLAFANDSIKSDTENTEAIRAMTKVLDSIDRRLS